MKSSSSQFITGLLVGLLGACLLFAGLGQRKSGSKSSGSGRELTVAHSQSVTHPVHKGIEEFGRELSALSGGQLTVKIFPSEQLGNETECIEKLQQGGIDIAKTSSAPMGSFIPAYKLFSLPYLFRDSEHFWKTLDGEIGNELLEAAGVTGEGKPSGLTGLGYYDAGSRSFYTTKPVATPADLKGLKIRVQKDPVAEDTVKALGASAVSIAFGELYTALKQGGVDGAENNPPSFHTSRHFEVCKHYALDAHSRNPDVLMASSKLWKSLNETERGWMREAAKRSSLYQRKLWAEESEKAMAAVSKEGVKVTEVDISLFQEAVKPVIEKHAKGEVARIAKSIQAVK